MDYKAIEELKAACATTATELLKAVKLSDAVKKSLPPDQLREVERLTSKEPIIQEAQEAMKNTNFDPSTW